MRAIQSAILSLGICLVSLPVSAQQSGNPQDTMAAEYWQPSRGVMSTAYTFAIVIETQDPEQIEAKILTLAKENDLNTTPKRYQNSEQRQIGLAGAMEKAETFSQKVVTLGKTTQYSTYSSRDEKQYADMKKKTELIEAELEKNKKLFAQLPIANTIMMNLLSKHQANIRTYESGADKAEITITLVTKRTK